MYLLTFANGTGSQGNNPCGTTRKRSHSSGHSVKSDSINLTHEPIESDPIDLCCRRMGPAHGWSESRSASAEETTTTATRAERGASARAPRLRGEASKPEHRGPLMSEEEDHEQPLVVDDRVSESSHPELFFLVALHCLCSAAWAWRARRIVFTGRPQAPRNAVAPTRTERYLPWTLPQSEGWEYRT